MEMPRHNGATLTKLVQFRLHNYGVEFWGPSTYLALVFSFPFVLRGRMYINLW